MKLSVLDYGVIDQQKTAREALKETVSLAQQAEVLGFSRFWVAEHHNISAFSTSSPEMLMMHLADQTKAIRIGSGGIMALHYSAYKIAELMKTLEALHPSRIDLGLGNTQGTTLVHRAMKSPHQKSDYADVLKQLKNHLYQDGFATTGISANPKVDTAPAMFVLGSSENTAKQVGALGLGYTFGIFPFMPKDLFAAVKAVPEVYRKHFNPCANLDKPYLIFACFIVIADTAEAAEDFAQCLDIWMLGKNDFNEFETYPSVEEAKNYILTEQEKEIIAANRSRVIVGTPDKVKQALNHFITLSGADEVLAIPLVPDIQNRRRTLQLLADLYL